MDMKKSRILIICMLLNAVMAMSQTDFVLSEQLFSRISINPAGTGNSENVNIFSLNRFQYVGVEGAPFTTMFNVQTYFDKASSGIGLSFSYDQSGVAYRQMQIKAVYAYHLNFGNQNIMSFGIGLGAYNKLFDPTKHIIEDNTEIGQGFPDEVQNSTFLDASFGIEYTNKYLLVGASITHIPGFFYESTTLTSVPNYYAYIRGLIPCGSKFKLAPAAAYYFTGQFHVADVSLTGFISDYVWIGLGYRTETTAYAMFGFEWNWLRIGYSCDINFGKLSNIAYTSHEVMLSFSIPTKKKGSEWKD